MSEETNEPAKINWSQVTDLSQVEITLAEQLQDGAKECKSKVFAPLLEAYATAPAEDGRLGIMFIKAGVDELEDVKVQKDRRALISQQLQEIAKTCSVEPTVDGNDVSPSTFEMLLKGFENATDDDKVQAIAMIKAGVDACEDADAQVAKRDFIIDFEEKHLPEALQEEPAAVEPVIVPKEAAPATTSAAVTKAISDLQKEFRAVAASLAKQQELTKAQAGLIRDQAGQIRNQAALITAQAGRIDALESGRKEDQAAVKDMGESMAEIGESVIQLSGVVKANAQTAAENIGALISTMEILDNTVQGKKAANDKANLTRFPRPNLA